MRINRRSSPSNIRARRENSSLRRWNGIASLASQQSTAFVGSTLRGLTTYSYSSPGIAANVRTSIPATTAIEMEAIETSADQWLRRNASRLEKYAGDWVAVTSKGIVATAQDFDDVFNRARAKGAMNPLVFKVPRASHPKVVSARQNET